MIMNTEFWATWSWLILHHCSPFTESECRHLQYRLTVAIHWIGVINRKFLSAAQVHILHLSCRPYRYLGMWCRYQLLQKCRMFWSQVLCRFLLHVLRILGTLWMTWFDWRQIRSWCDSENTNLITVQQDATYSVYYSSVGRSTCFGCWHPSSAARTTVITASGID